MISGIFGLSKTVNTFFTSIKQYKKGLLKLPLFAKCSNLPDFSVPPISPVIPKI